MLEAGQVVELEMLQIQSHFQCSPTCQGTSLQGAVGVEMDCGMEMVFGPWEWRWCLVEHEEHVVWKGWGWFSCLEASRSQGG